MKKTAEDEAKQTVLRELITNLSCPLKLVLSAHQLDKQCAYEILKKLMDLADRQTAVIMEGKFGGKFICKTNEPEKL